jgi:glycosyltransferase involved in cell wall biosynthesis
MKIAVNARLLIPGKLDGIGWFTFETLIRIIKNHPEAEFIFIFDRKPDKSLQFPNNVKVVVIHPPTRHPFLWYFWFEWRLPALLKKLKPDLFLSTDGYISLRTEIPQLAVIHDINFIHRPQDLPLLTGSYFRYFFPKFAKKAKAIATVSDYSKKDISQTFPIDMNKIDVVYNGANTLFSPVSEFEKNKWKSEYTGSSGYFAYVGSLHPRKNIDGLLLAFEDFKKTDNSGMKLLIVGEPLFKIRNIQKVFSKMTFKNDLIMMGRLSPEDLRLAIGSSHALILVSHFEGFGIPVLESMKCRVPVICSDKTSLPEVAGDTALLVDPASPQSISEAMSKLTKDIHLRDKLAEKGFQRAGIYSWDRTSELLWHAIEKAIQSSC